MALAHAGILDSLPPGTEVGPWRVVRRCGSGAYGVVYLVEKIGYENAGLFALKMARYPLDPRFEREGELLSRIHHRHVPQLHGRGWWMAPGGMAFPYIVMDWIEGVPLYSWASEQPRSWRQMMRVLAQVARALAATHAVEGVHRDVKGENVLVRKADGTAVLIDFGSANHRGASTLTWQPPPPGTPQYQSPESMRFEAGGAHPSDALNSPFSTRQRDRDSRGARACGGDSRARGRRAAQLPEPCTGFHAAV